LLPGPFFFLLTTTPCVHIVVVTWKVVVLLWYILQNDVSDDRLPLHCYTSDPCGEGVSRFGVLSCILCYYSTWPVDDGF
jgi:hypothetical protein